MRKIAENSVLDYLDVDKYNEWIKREKKEKKALVEFGENLSKK